ncbi:Uncharacterized protein GBIM_03659 [Gryllus bimaculatus]|nr:Uncharacterized protein GBIM_03659 [Gryllus bimaculatus]
MGHRREFLSVTRVRSCCSPDAWYSTSSFSRSYSQEQDPEPGSGRYLPDGAPKRTRGGRRPSLERQTTLYDDVYYTDVYAPAEQAYRWVCPPM